MVEEMTKTDNRHHYKALFDNNPNSVYLFDPNGLLLSINAAGRLELNISDEALKQHRYLDFIQEKDRDKAWQDFLRAKNGEVVIEELRVEREAKHPLELQISIIPVMIEGQVVSIYVIAQDITDRKQLEHSVLMQKHTESALSESQAKLRMITEHMTDLMAIVDVRGIIQYVSPSYETVLGYRLPPGVTSFDYYHPDDVPSIRQAHQQLLLTRQKVTIELRYLHRDGHYLIHESTRLPVVEPDGTIEKIVITSRDITERKKWEATIQHMAYHDALTDLPNRTLFKERLNEALVQNDARNRIVGMLMIDLDGFKNVNDTLGHTTGDELLQQAAHRLGSVLTGEQTVYRIGGDEFSILLPHERSVEDVILTAERILKAFAEPWPRNGSRTLHVTASIGISLAPKHGLDAETLMRNADMAMYRAKEKGKNNYQCFDPSLNEKIIKRVMLEDALREAIENDELTLYYQPQVDARNREIVGAEALIRWNRPGIGMVSPSEFIPLAEETGLIVPIGDWVLRSACEQAKRWEQHGYPFLRVSVNLSARQFLEPLFLAQVKKMIEATGISPDRIDLEITESLIMQDVEYAIHTLRELRNMGFQISIDDFGTGYSSLNYLKRFPVDKLKIDQTFVRDITHDIDDEAIIKTIIALAKNLNLSIIAEGVETEAQLRALVEKDCPEVQGYLFSRPIPPEEFEEKFLAGKADRK